MIPPKANNRLTVSQRIGNCQADSTVFEKLYFIFQIVNGKPGNKGKVKYEVFEAGIPQGAASGFLQHSFPALASKA